MKKLLITPLIFLMLTFTACGSASTGLQVDSVTGSDSLPIAAQLLVGTLRLDDSEQAVTTEQAVELLPLWQVYSELLSSDIAAQEEIDGLIAQIQETMSDEQMQAIEDMALTQQDVMSAIQKNDGEIIQASQSGSSSSGGNNSGGFAPPDGGIPMDAISDGGAGMPADMPIGGQTSSGSDNATTAAGQGPMGSGVSTALVEALIESLQSKVNS